jgi:hypothetical protein
MPKGLRKATAPGKCVSVDQLKLPIPRLMGQVKGIPATKRHNYVTVFVDHFSHPSYLVLQEIDTAHQEDKLHLQIMTIHQKMATCSPISQ